jgi:hypothetical protein
MSVRSAYDTTTEGPLEASEPLVVRSAGASPRLEDLDVRRPLDSGRRVDVESPGDGTDRVVVRNPEGEVELEVVLTESGPRLRFRAAEIELESQGRLGLRCTDLDVHASGHIRQVAGDGLEQKVVGDAQLSVSGDLSSLARSTRIESRRGDVRIRANDDVLLNGERVKLNC